MSRRKIKTSVIIFSQKKVFSSIFQIGRIYYLGTTFKCVPILPTVHQLTTARATIPQFIQYSDDISIKRFSMIKNEILGSTYTHLQSYYFILVVLGIPMNQI